MARKYWNLSERILQGIRIDKNGCWTWTKALNRGYGVIGADGKVRRVHRCSYELLVGPIPEGLQIDHLCRNRACCNPRHLEPVTAKENQLRGLLATRPRCGNGHEYAVHGFRNQPYRYKTADGEWRHTTTRRCLECSRQRSAQYRAKHRKGKSQCLRIGN